MAKKARRVPPKERPRQNTPLLFLLLIMVPLFGGYYHFSVFLSGAALVLLLLHGVWRAGALRLPVGPEAWCLYGLCGVTLLTIPFGVSSGMAFAGFLRLAVWVLFFLYAATYTDQERADILNAVAYEGAVLSLITIAGFLYDAAAGIDDPNGRIDGFFQYANTWSLFLLACLILLALKDRRHPADWPAMAALLCGVYLSGSRGVFLLLLPLALAWGVHRLVRLRDVKTVALAAGGMAAIGVLAVLLSGGLVLDRLRAITLSSSSLNGRLLYYLDGAEMLLRHPLGVGYGGYLYLQPLEQTGVYTLRFIHNEYLQAALDGGIPAGLCMAGLSAALLLRRGAPVRERAVGFAIAAHACIDFDFQFSAVAFLLLLCGSGGRCRELPLRRRRLSAGLAGAAALVLCYFSTVYALDFFSRPREAWALFPADLSLAENRLQSFPDVDSAQPAADAITASTDLSLLAWDCKLAAAAQRADLPAMVESKYQYLRLSRYRGEVYQDFADLLENACVQGSREELVRYKTLAQSVLSQLEEVNQATSPLAYRIADKPELEFTPRIADRMNQIIERIDTP